MGGLSILLGILTLIFLLVILTMNLVNRTYIDSFVDTPSTPARVPSEIEKQIREGLEKLAFYTSPGDGSPSDGKQLCSIFSIVRKQMARSQRTYNTNLDESEINKRVEDELSNQIPGGALPCPLLIYPIPDSTDLEWLAFLQDIPMDFGARVIFMAQFADVKLTEIAGKLKDALSSSTPLPDLTKIDTFTGEICPPDIAVKKRSDTLEASCILPEDMTPEQIQEAVRLVLEQLNSKKRSIIEKVVRERKAASSDSSISDRNPIDNPAMGTDTDPSIHQNIINAQIAAKYLSDQLDAVEAGKLVPSPNPMISG